MIRRRPAAYPAAMTHPKLHTTLAAAAIALLIHAAPLAASEADDRIESSFKKSFVYKTYLKDDAVSIDAKDGVVTLTGTVVEDGHKGLAQETAGGMPGVTRVDNQLTTKGDAANAKSDSWMASKIRMALVFHRNVHAGRTVVEVKDGVVTLKGPASSLAQKELTAEYAKDIDGVKEVRNEMTVLAAPDAPERSADEKVDDASIIAQVKTALQAHRSTSSLKAKVEARSGEVTLTGICRNDAEKSMVTKLVTDIQGVTSVQNQMTVDQLATR